MIDDEDQPPGFKFATRALDRIAAERLEPFPANFTLWFSYYSDILPDLTRMIDVLAKSGQPFNQARCDELFQRFFGSDAEARAIREAGERTQTAIGKLQEVLREAESGISRYGEALGGFHSSLDDQAPLERLRAAVAAIAAETEAIAEEHRRLQRRLSETGSALSQLRARLYSARRELMIDSLTGIANRKGFEAALTDAAAAAQAEAQPMSLLMIDLDHFKSFNDRHGHLVGDMVLRLTAKVLTDCVKGRDTVARFGGEEFVVILPGTRLQDAVCLADHLRQTLGRKQIINRNRTENFGTVTLSIGVAEYRPRESFYDLINRADAALYLAKRTGRDRVCFKAEDVPSSAPAPMPVS
ncbi:MAG: GGDEF domain-containing protein [Rhodospirillaceae bacterium]